MGSDAAVYRPEKEAADFNPRSPCGERPDPVTSIRGSAGFQSTLPVWGATVMRNCLSLPDVISIHAPRVGSDQAMATKAGMNGLFQSTLPVWGATGILIISHGGRRNFNPRSPCGERPRVLPSYRSSVYHFNPRSPCGERRVASSRFRLASRFQSTLPVWGATVFGTLNNVLKMISIHAPRVGSDGPAPSSTKIQTRFQSTLPVWGATGSDRYLPRPHPDFNPRSPCGERLP